MFSVLCMMRKDFKSLFIDDEVVSNSLALTLSTHFLKTMAIEYKAPTVHIDKDQIKRMLPMLFIAKYDPSPAVRSVMKDLWYNLSSTGTSYSLSVGDADGLLQTEQSAILLCMLECLTSRVWRERESASWALEAFLPDKRWSFLWPQHIPVLLDKGLNVMDDVRDSTRQASVGFMKVVSDIIVRACDPDTQQNDLSRGIIASSESNSVIIEYIMPWLLDKGMLCSFPEGRGYCIGLLVRVIKVARNSLRTWLIRLVRTVMYLCCSVCV